MSQTQNQIQHVSCEGHPLIHSNFQMKPLYFCGHYTITHYIEQKLQVSVHTSSDFLSEMKEISWSVLRN